MMSLLAALAGLAAAASVLLTIRGIVGASTAEPTVRPPSRWHALWHSATDPKRRNRLLAALGTGLAVLLVLGWPVAAVAAGTAAYALPRMLSGRQAQQRIARLEALEAWSRRLAEVMGASRGLEQALADSLRIAPAPIHAPVASLADRLNNRASAEGALRAFATELDDPVGDLIAAALILASRRRGPGTRDALATLADAVAQEVRLRRDVEAERASLRTTLTVIVISVGTLTAVFFASGTLAAPYGTALGQLVLAAVTGLYAVGLWWMKRLSAITTGSRILDASTHPTAPSRPKEATS
jgi:tight adherence protein B